MIRALSIAAVLALLAACEAAPQKPEPPEALLRICNSYTRVMSVGGKRVLREYHLDSFNGTTASDTPIADGVPLAEICR